MMVTTTDFDASMDELVLHSRPQRCEKAKFFAPVILQSSQSILVKLGMFVELVGPMNLILIYLCQINIHERL